MPISSAEQARDGSSSFRGTLSLPSVTGSPLPMRYCGSLSQHTGAPGTQKDSLTCSVISVALVFLNILGPVTVRGVEEVNVFIIVTGQELCREQAHSSEGKG